MLTRLMTNRVSASDIVCIVCKAEFAFGFRFAGHARDVRVQVAVVRHYIPVPPVSSYYVALTVW